MRQINKKKEPNSLAEYKKTAGAFYNGLNSTVKNKIRNSLLDEQGHVCAYCMRRIKVDNMKIEHWASQTVHTELELQYSNLLACCNGNEGRPYPQQTCDTRKGNETLKFSPANKNHLINLKVNYLNGKVRSHDTDFNNQINSVLNLNESRLVANRKAVIDTLRKFLLDNINGRVPNSKVESLLTNYKVTGNGMHKEFYGLIINYLESKLKPL